MPLSIRTACFALAVWSLIGAWCLFGAGAGAAIAQSSFENGFSGQFFFTYEHDLKTVGDPVSEFTIKRGYVTFRRSITEQASIRFTQDISIDEEGDGAGDIELRLKYALVNLRLGDRGILTSPQVELGVVRRPWIDFEQKINDYRSQKEMFLDQNGILSSADYGVTFQSNLGKPRGGGEAGGGAANSGAGGAGSTGGGSWADAGIGYQFTNRSKVIVDVSRREAWQGRGFETVERMEIVFEIRF